MPPIRSTNTCCRVVSVEKHTAAANTNDAKRQNSGISRFPRTQSQHSQLMEQWMDGKRLSARSIQKRKRIPASKRPVPFTGGRTFVVGRITKNRKLTILEMMSAQNRRSLSSRGRSEQKYRLTAQNTNAPK